MTGDDSPEIKSFQDYLTAVLPICFGALNMTAQEIYESTPWEIEMRIKGYKERLKTKRIFTASLLTVPIINAGFSRPKNGVDLKDVLPDDLADEAITKDELDKWRDLLNNARQGGKHGRR